MVKSEECLGADFRYSGREVLSVAIHVLRLGNKGTGQEAHAYQIFALGMNASAGSAFSVACHRTLCTARNQLLNLI